MALALTARERRRLALSRSRSSSCVRLATLGAYPLMDTTESRYAEIARKMLETGDWLMPQFDYGIPFWGKPPLSTWLSAASMAVFGVNEFAARLPSLLLLRRLRRARLRGSRALRAGRDARAVDGGAVRDDRPRLRRAGAVMTDPALAFGTTLSMAGFWLAVRRAAPPRGAQRASRSSSGSRSACSPRARSPSC